MDLSRHHSSLLRASYIAPNLRPRVVERVGRRTIALSPMLGAGEEEANMTRRCGFEEGYLTVVDKSQVFFRSSRDGG